MVERFKFTPSGRGHSAKRGIIRGSGGMVGTGGGMHHGSSPTAMLNTFLGLMDRAVNYSREQSLEDNAREFAKNVLNLGATETERFVHPNNLVYAQQLMNQFLERGESKKINKKNAQVLQKLFPPLQGDPSKPNVLNPLEGEYGAGMSSFDIQGLNPDKRNNEQVTNPLDSILPSSLVSEKGSSKIDENFYQDFPLGEDVSASDLTARIAEQEEEDLPSSNDLAAGVAEITRENQGMLGIETIDEGLQRKNGEEIGATMSQSTKEQNKPHKETSVMRATEQVLRGDRSIIPPLENIEGLPTSELVEKSIGDQLFHNIFKENVNKLGLKHPLLTGLMELNIDELTDLYGTETGQSLIKSVYTQYFNTLNNNYKTRLKLGEQYQAAGQKKANVKAKLEAEVESKIENLGLFEDKQTTFFKDSNTGNIKVMQVGPNTGNIFVTEIPNTKGLNKLPLPLKLTAGTTPVKGMLSKIQEKFVMAQDLSTELSELKNYLVSDDGQTSLTYFDKSARGMLQKLGSFKAGIMFIDAMGKNELTKNFTQEQVKELRRFEQFSQNAQNQFIRFRKFITGVAGGEFEMGEIKKAFFNLEEDDWFTLTAKVDGLLELQQRIYTGANAILKDNTIGGKAKTDQLNQLVEQSLAKSPYTWDTFYVKRKDNSKVMNDNLNSLKDLLSKKGIE